MTEPSDFISVVSGLPRSGTSMMMRMLEAGGMPVLVDNIRRPDQDNPRGYYEYEPVKGLPENTGWLPEARGKAVKMVYALLYRLPPGYHYRVIVMQRKMEEVIASQRKMLERQGQAPGPLDDAQLAAGFTRQLARLRTWLAEQPNFSLLEVNYNQMLAEPAPLAEVIGAFLDCPLDVRSMAATVDASLYHQRR